MHKASSNTEEVPDCSSRPSIPFQGHKGTNKVTRLVTVIQSIRLPSQHIFKCIRYSNHIQKLSNFHHNVNLTTKSLNLTPTSFLQETRLHWPTWYLRMLAMSKCRCDVDVGKVPDVVGVKCSFMLLYIIGHKGPQKVHIFIHLIRFTLERKLRNRSCITVTSWWARWRLRSSASQLFTTVYSGADQRKHQSSASLAFVRGIHRWPVIPAQRANNAEMS